MPERHADNSGLPLNMQDISALLQLKKMLIFWLVKICSMTGILSEANA
ncbi:hypothetical protein [uncultured Methanospirillum sp.]|nr:hypothetical protein [uncultured Methanospirillum sp.]